MPFPFTEKSHDQHVPFAFFVRCVVGGVQEKKLQRLQQDQDLTRIGIKVRYGSDIADESNCVRRILRAAQVADLVAIRVEGLLTVRRSLFKPVPVVYCHGVSRPVRQLPDYLRGLARDDSPIAA